MLTIMFDPHFKSLQAMENYVKHEDYIHFAFKWCKHGSPSLLTVFEVLNPTIKHVLQLLDLVILLKKLIAS
jgi:hypothetical protein